MRHVITILLLVLGPTSSTQVEKYAGVYEMRHEAQNALIEYRLSLNPDGSFLFQSYSKHNRAITPVTDIYGKGKWSVKKDLILFSVDEENDIVQEYSLNFNETKARYKTKSPRDLSQSVVKTSLIFYDSNIFWVKGMELFKKED